MQYFFFLLLKFILSLPFYFNNSLVLPHPLVSEHRYSPIPFAYTRCSVVDYFYFVLSGDTRANENTNLISMHLILARQHNNISSLLRAFNPFWNDEMLYQESRRILAAQLQHITYNEFLPGIIGRCGDVIVTDLIG